MKKGQVLMGLIVLLVGGMINNLQAGEHERKIELSKVPAKVLAAAKKKLKGFKPSEAEKEAGEKYTEYELEGTANGKNYEVEVKVDKKGKIIKVKVSADDDDGEDEDKDEKDDD